jgi:hypothetical protein
MDNLQNEYYYKNLLSVKMSEFIEEITQDDNELGWISENMESNMTEAAWLIVKQNVDTNNYFKKEDMLKD